VDIVGLGVSLGSREKKTFQLFKNTIKRLVGLAVWEGKNNFTNVGLENGRLVGAGRRD